MGFLGFDAQARAPRVGELVYGYNSSTDRHLVGTVRNIYGDQAEVSWLRRDGMAFFSARSYWRLSSLSVEVLCSGEVCLGRTVHVPSSSGGVNYVGAVQHVFENGKTEVYWDSANGAPTNYPNDNYHDATSLSYRVTCLGELCEGDQVHFSHRRPGRTSDTNYVGTIDRLYTGGRIDHGAEGQGVAEITYEREDGVAVDYNAAGYWHTSRLHERTAGDGRK